MSVADRGQPPAAVPNESGFTWPGRVLCVGHVIEVRLLFLHSATATAFGDDAFSVGQNQIRIKIYA
jgi:hypothetical protein